MLRWWLRVGIWVGLGIIIVSVGFEYWLFTLIEPIGAPEYWLWLSSNSVILLTYSLLALWLWAAIVAYKTLDAEKTEGAAVGSVRDKATRFAVGFCQGIVPVLAKAIAEASNDLIYRTWRDTQNGVYGHSTFWDFDVMEFSLAVFQMSSLALSAVWLIGLIVLIPQGRRLSWLLLIAGVVGGVAGSTTFLLTAPFDPQNPIYPAGIVPLGLLLGVAVVTSVYYGFGTGRKILGNAAYRILFTSLLLSEVLSFYYSGNTTGIFRYPLLLLRDASWPYYTLPFSLFQLESSIYQRWPWQQQVLQPFLQWLPSLCAILWVAILFTAMYYFLRWVEKAYPGTSDARDATQGAAT
jgi:hypothetical protein